ncbi:MAG: divergent polysaccharide deacetylase family protein [Thermodesulfobacteriota bacterium]|nr:divergent polysaccharide deacetylase family protein [Thermodesulfobacteriota bacterium]
MKKKRRNSRFRRILIGFGIFILFIAAISVVCISNIETVKNNSKERVRKYHSEIYVSRDITPPSKKQKVAIIIDDIGYDLSPLNELLKINAPITFSILPHCPYSIDAAEKLHRAGKEILLHLPMEPYGYPDKNPGTGALFSWMNEEEIKRQTKEDIEAVPYISGVNNHMGSKFMENEDKLNIVLNQLNEEGLFFVDSLTTRHSKGKKLAKEIGLRFVSRDIFIDNNQDFTLILQNFTNPLKKRKRWKTLLIIGHPYPCTISALKDAVLKIKAEGIDIVPVSDLINN